MRVAAVGDVHGRESLGPFRDALAGIEEPDLFLLAGDLTDHNRMEEFGEVVEAVKARTTCPIACVFGNNEWSADHGKYRQKFELEFLDDEARTFSLGGTSVRVIGSTGALDEPTWWQRTNLPGIAQVYEARVRRLDQLLAGDGVRILLTHYPPTHATMGGEKPEWRPQLGSKRLEAVVLRRQPKVVIHGHIHRGIPFAELRGGGPTLESYGAERRAISVYNVAFPVTRGVTTVEM